MTPEQVLTLQTMKEAQAQSVAGVHVPAKLLTDKERSRHLKVSDQLSKGQNPYNVKRATFDAGGSILDKPIDRSHITEASDRQFADLEKKWADRSLDRDEISSSILDDEDEIAPQPKVIGVDEFQCSFCRDVFPRMDGSRSLMTIGTGSPRKSYKREFWRDSNDKLQVTEKVIHFSSKLQACPNCALHIDKVKFPETHG